MINHRSNLLSSVYTIHKDKLHLSNSSSFLNCNTNPYQINNSLYEKRTWLVLKVRFEYSNCKVFNHSKTF